MAKQILIAIGANLPDADGRPALETCRWAVSQLAALPELQLVARSRWFETAPVPVSVQPNYVNGVVCLSGLTEPCALLAVLHEIEGRAGRVRNVPDAARTLDLDLLAIDGLIVNEPGLVLPHPRMHLRAFVLAPLCDVAPGWVHPVLHCTAAALLARTGPGSIHILGR